MGFVFVAFWMLACMDLLCFGSLLGSISFVLGSCWVIVGVLGACWCQCAMFWELVGLIFGA